MSARIAALVLAVAAAAPAQQVQVQLVPPSPSTVRLGQTCEARLRVYNADARIQPEVPLVHGAILRLGGPSSVQNNDNGRVTRFHEYALRVTPQRAGSVTIPAFPVRVGDRVFRTRAFAVEAVADLRGKDRGFLLVEPSSQQVYVNEPLRFLVECGIDKGLQVAVRGNTRAGDKVFDVDVRAPWLAELDGASPLETPAPSDSLLILQNTDKAQPVEYDEVERGGRKYHRFRFEKAFLPGRVGRLELPGPIFRFVVLTGRARTGLFGERIRGSSEELFVYGEPIEIEVLPLPKEGRPEDYSGGVGRFTMSARLDKDRVKVGNSVKVVLKIEGVGNTERFGVPALKLPDEWHLLGQTEQRGRDGVEVTYDLTPLTAAAREVPPIYWNYFDTRPDVADYRTLQTGALPLTVVPLAENETLAALPGQPSDSIQPGVDDIFDIKSLDDGGAMPLPASPQRGFAGLMLALPWVLGLALAAAFAWRRRRAADVTGQRARGAARKFARAVGSGGDPHGALVRYLAERLGVAEAAIIGPELEGRLGEAGVPDELLPAVCDAVEAGVAARYGGQGGVDAQAARALVDQLERAPLQRLAGGGAGILLALLALSGSVATQGVVTQGVVAQGLGREAEAAYRSGDYATAGARFAAAAEARPDVRVLYNLGNCLYREGKLGPALVAWERARLGMPRDAELNANLKLVRAQLDLGRGEGEPFLDAVRALRDRFTARELLWIALACHAFAALGLTLGRRRRVLRGLGFVALAPALLLTFEVLWWGPARPPAGIVVATRIEVVAEPREGLEALMKLKEGVAVEVLGEGPEWTHLRVRGRSGYVQNGAVGVVRR